VIAKGEVKISSRENKTVYTKLAGETFGGCSAITPGFKQNFSSTVSSANVLLYKLNESKFGSFKSSCPSEVAASVQLLLDSAIYGKEPGKIFKGLSPESLSILHMLLKPIPCFLGDTLYEENDTKSKSIYMVGSGSFEALVGHDDQRVLFVYEKFDIFGVESMVEKIPRPSTIKCVSSRGFLYELSPEGYACLCQLPDWKPEKMTKFVKECLAHDFKKYQAPFFQSIPDSKLDVLASLCHIMRTQPGEVIFKQGDIGSTFFMTASGECKVSITKLENGEAKTSDVATMKPGMCFGEIALVQECQRTATITSNTACVFLTMAVLEVIVAVR